MNKDFDVVMKEFFKKSAKHDVVSLTSRERDVLNYLLDNRETIYSDISLNHNKNTPKHLEEIYKSQFKNQALEIIKNHLVQFNLNPEEDASLEQLIDKTIGSSILEPLENDI